MRRSTYIPASPDAPDFTTHRTIREVLLRVVRTERLDGVVALETAALLHGGRAARARARPADWADASEKRV